MKRLQRHRTATRRLLGVAAALTMVITGYPAVAAASPSPVSVFQPQLNCQPETYPYAHTPRNATGRPYQIPFKATLDGGNLAIHSPTSTVGVTFGYPTPTYPTGTLFGEACGLLTLPSQAGAIAGNPYGVPAGNPYGVPALPDNPQYNNNFILHGPPSGTANDTNPVPVAITVNGTGVPLLDGYGSVSAAINTRILPTPAANGGFNVTFTNTAKATAVIDPAELGQLLLGTSALDTTLIKLLTPLLAVAAGGGGECTLAVGDLATTGLPPQLVNGYTQPLLVSSDPNATGGIGKPVTGPVTGGHAVGYTNNFPVAPVSAQMPPSPNAPNATLPASSLCNPIVAAAFTTLLGLPSPAGYSTFTAPITFFINSRLYH